MTGSSSELQRISLVGFINDVYLLSKCYKEVNESFYSSLSYKLIYRALKSYYEKYLKLPTISELIIMIEKLYTEDYGNLDSIKEECKSIYGEKVASEDFVYENVIEFMKRYNIEKELNNVVKYIKDGNINLEEVANNLSRSINLNINRSPVYHLSDISKIEEVRTDALGNDDNPVMIKFFIDPVNRCMQYKAIPPRTLNMVVGPPGRGKTTMLINQGLSAAKQGYNNLHIFLGDMTKFDGLLRYLSCLSGVPTSTLVDLSAGELTKFVQKWNMSGVLSHIYIASYAADELTANQLIEEISSIQKSNNVHFEQIIVDYDENLAYEADSTYLSGGQVYNKLALLATVNKSVVFIASQPKVPYWNEEVIPLEGASESSKKQKIIDLMLCLGKPSKSSSIATLYIAKNRRGQDSKMVRLSTIGENARIETITEDEYQRIKSNERSSARANNGND